MLAVHDARGWHLDPYVALGESFYALTSDFRVRLDHPSALKVPATGRTRTLPGGPGRTVTVGVADRVRDFAWAAGPFRTATQTSPGGVRVTSYWAAGTPAEGVRLTRADAVAAIDRFGREFGRAQVPGRAGRPRSTRRRVRCGWCCRRVCRPGRCGP
ncbi:hypothetical protein J2X68_004779 [Streptomyces sp. 3330]|nr:hypothetical protein [Streptomyces sp. 3330]